MGKRHNADMQLLQLVICFTVILPLLVVLCTLGDTPTMSKTTPASPIDRNITRQYTPTHSRYCFCWGNQFNYLLYGECCDVCCPVTPAAGVLVGHP
jgi:hypothetical protein